MDNNYSDLLDQGAEISKVQKMLEYCIHERQAILDSITELQESLGEAEESVVRCADTLDSLIHGGVFSASTTIKD